jgi:hypothetical protein
LLVCWLRFACLARETRTRSEWRLALVLVDRVTDTDTVRPRFAHTAITAMPHMPVRLTDTTDLAGSPAASSSARVPGSTTMATTVADTTVMAIMVGEDTTATAATMGAVLSATTQAADIAVVPQYTADRLVDSTAAVAEASMVEAATDK